MRATMKMPAVTIVAAWISAEIGVGPSIESGSHTCSGTCARLAHRADEQADADHRHQPTRRGRRRCPASLPRSSAPWRTRSRSPACRSNAARRPMPSRKPKSPTRLTRNALRLAKIAVGRLYQKPISRYDTRPTASQPKNSCRKLFAHHQHQHREREQRDVAEEALCSPGRRPCSRWCRCAPSATRRSPPPSSSRSGGRSGSRPAASRPPITHPGVDGRR